jgi:hypothetical protein
LPGKTDKTTGCIILPQPLQPNAHGKKTLCPSAYKPNLFYQFSSEAFLLTVLVNTNIFLSMNNEKRSAKACQGARPGVWPSGVGSDRPDLIFGLPLYQDKGNSRRGN